MTATATATATAVATALATTFALALALALTLTLTLTLTLMMIFVTLGVKPEQPHGVTPSLDPKKRGAQRFNFSCYFFISQNPRKCRY